MIPRPPISTLCPYPTLFRSIRRWQGFTGKDAVLDATGQTFEEVKADRTAAAPAPVTQSGVATPPSSPTAGTEEDRKSTRLNSSHANISYAVFCLKKTQIRPI